MLKGPVSFGTTTLENVFLLKVNEFMTFGPVTLLLRLHLTVMHTYVNRERCTQMFRAASLITAPDWTQPMYALAMAYN